MNNRLFFPGDKWVYFKIYTSPYNTNNILLKNINHVISLYKELDLMELWFFIRYADPYHHIRVRIKAKCIENIGEIIAIMRRHLNEALMNGIISSLQICTYVRELERYGVKNMDNSEIYFHKDSVNVLNTLATNPSESDLICTSVEWSHNFLNSLGLPSKDIMEYVTDIVHKYQHEFNFSQKQINTINIYYRNIRPRLLEILKNTFREQNQEDNGYNWIKENLHETAVLQSLIHMHFNRIFSTNQRLYEYITYHIYKKTYDSILKICKIP